MGQKQCVQLLQQNFNQEEAMAKRVATLSKQLGEQMIPKIK
jgi:ferritin-like metal-binding protein YciE